MLEFQLEVGRLPFSGGEIETEPYVDLARHPLSESLSFDLHRLSWPPLDWDSKLIEFPLPKGKASVTFGRPDLLWSYGGLSVPNNEIGFSNRFEIGPEEKSLGIGKVAYGPLSEIKNIRSVDLEGAIGAIQEKWGLSRFEIQFEKNPPIEIIMRVDRCWWPEDIKNPGQGGYYLNAEAVQKAIKFYQMLAGLYHYPQNAIGSKEFVYQNLAKLDIPREFFQQWQVIQELSEREDPRKETAAFIKNWQKVIGIRYPVF